MAIVVGCVIGAGVFFKPYAIYQQTGGAPGMGMLSRIIGGVSIIMLVYIIINIAYIRVLPADELMNIESPAAAVAEKIFGSFGATFDMITNLAVFSCWIFYTLTFAAVITWRKKIVSCRICVLA